MADNVDSIMPRIMTEIRDELRASNRKLDSMDKKLDKLDKLDSMDRKLDRIIDNTNTTNERMSRLIEVISNDMAEQMADIRRRLTSIESRLPPP